MPLDRPVAFPLHLIKPDGTCACAKGATCSRVGKHPAVLWKEVELGSDVPLPAPGAGYGIKTGAKPRGSDLVVVDLDGADAVDAWLELGGADDTYTVSTGRGLHLYFQHPGFPVNNSKSALGPQIDIRGDGGFVVGPGSPHISGIGYSIAQDIAPAPLPAWLLAWFKQQPVRAEIQPHPEDVTGEERARRREIYGSWLASEAPICRQGQDGDGTLFKVVQRGAYDLALPTEDVLEAIEEHYDHRCDPPWGDELEERVLHKANDAKTKSTKRRDPPLLLAEEAMWAETDVFAPASIQPTRLVDPRQTPTGNEDTFGFKLKRGGWDVVPVPPNYLVDNLLVENKVSMIFAEPGTIKSWTAIDIAACVSEGLPWLGERETIKGPALYVDFEDGEHEFHRRVHLLTGHSDRPNLIYTYSPGSIQNQEFWVRLEKLAKAYGIKFVAIDTLAGATVGEDENATNAAAGLIYAGWFTESTGATVLVLHHANKTGDIRGTSAFKASVDTLFKLESVEDENGVHKAKLSCIKSGHKKVFPVHLELTDDGLRKYEPEAKASAEGEEEKKRSVSELQGEVLLLIEQEGPFASVEMVRERVKARASTVNAILAELSASGDVYRSPEGWRRDNETLRAGRLRAAVQRLPGCGRTKLVAEAGVPREFFERKQMEGCIRPAIVGDDSGGFIWTDVS